MKQITAVILLILFAGSAVAVPGFKVRDSCQQDETNLFSLNSTTGGNVSEPGELDWQVCGSGIEYSSIEEECGPGENHVISMKSRKGSTASIYSNYQWKVCVPNTNIFYRESCERDPIVSMESKEDARVADANHFSHNLCPSSPEPVNTTLELSLNAEDIYVSGEPAEERIYTPDELEFPYIVSGQPTGIVSHGELLGIRYLKRDRDVFRVKQSGGSFLLPHTKGGYVEVENDQRDIKTRNFLDLLEPSFAFEIPEKPVVKVILQPDRTTEGFEDERSGYVNIAVRNAFANGTVIRFKPSY